MEVQPLLAKLYANRFDEEQKEAKLKLWQVLIDQFLNKYIDESDTVLDIAGGYCEFINSIHAREKYLIDLNPETEQYADKTVKFIHGNVLNERLIGFVNGKIDKIFVSNFFEHLNTKEELLAVLSFCYKSLKIGGSLLIIQPNFKYSYREYYDFLDHVLPVTDASLKEALQAVGFEIELMIPRFLPFSTKGRPASPILLSTYLKLPFLWQFFGGQMFVKATRRN
jgi:SAM-dependent methyltransferase